MEENNKLVNQQHSWYLIFTKARAEQSAQQNLERQGYATYLPLVQTQYRRNGQYKKRVEAFFPRYLFIQLNSETDNWAPIRSTIGVAGLVRFGGIPAQVPRQLIESLQHNENEQGLQWLEQKKMQPGDPVDIIDGPFAGQTCIFQAMKGSDRVTVLLDIIGKNTPATLSMNNLKLAG